MRDEFVKSLQALLPGDEATALVCALTASEPTVSVRVNTARGARAVAALERVPWCRDGYYLKERPAFALDPMWHAGMYYVQDASSMFISHVLRQLVHESVTYLDLCAAPGGKTTAALQALPAGSTVVANEVMPQRALALCDNVSRWGCDNVAVTNAQPGEFGRRLPATFDVVAIDAPCSGEGMMRKDSQAVAQWSPALVAQCAALQRSIIDDAWDTLKTGGLLIYSTCTFNREENERMVEHIVSRGAESVAVNIEPQWSIMEGINTPHACYRFMPHRTRGEGLFMAVLRKTGDTPPRRKQPKIKPVQLSKPAGAWCNTAGGTIVAAGDTIGVTCSPLLASITATVRTLQAGTPVVTLGFPKPLPHPALAYSTRLQLDSLPAVDIDEYATAITYLRGEALTLPACTPAGLVTLCYNGVPLGFARNLGNRANNLYPKPWRITRQNAPRTAVNTPVTLDAGR